MNSPIGYGEIHFFYIFFNKNSRFDMFSQINTPKDLIPTDPRFGAGPSKVPVEFIEKLLSTKANLLGTSHRKPAVKNLGMEITNGLKEYFKLPEDYCVVYGNGGATLLFDMIGLGMVEKESSHFTCGEFSRKWFKSHDKIPWIQAEEINVDFGQGQSFGDCRNSASDMICVTLNETSTGVIIDDLPTIREDQILAVDATSGGGQVPCDLSKVDLFFFSPQKVFASEGGLFVAIMSPKARERALKIGSDANRYFPDIMSWKQAIDNSDKFQVYNTPSISTLFFLNEQIKLMNEVGYENVVAKGNELSSFIYNWAESKPYLSPFIEEKKYRSNVVCTINVDEKYPVSELLSKLHEEKVVYGIESYRKLGKNQFRIGVFHNVDKSDVIKLTQLLSYYIENA